MNESIYLMKHTIGNKRIDEIDVAKRNRNHYDDYRS